MVKHVVCFKLLDGSEKEKSAAKEVLSSMVGRVPLFESIEVGTDFLKSNRSYDVYLAVTFKSRELLEAYQNDEYHVSVVKKYMHAHAEKSVSVDFEY